MFEEENLGERLDFILEAMMDDCQSLLETNNNSGIDLDDVDTCVGIYHGNFDLQDTIANALIDPRIRNGFIAQWTDNSIMDTADAVGSPFTREMLQDACSYARKKTAMYLGIIMHAGSHHEVGFSGTVKSALNITMATLALLDDAWEVALILYLKAVELDEQNEFAHTMLQNCLTLRGQTATLIKDAFNNLSTEDLLAGHSLL